MSIKFKLIIIGQFSLSDIFFCRAMAQWSACRTRDPVVAGSIPTTGHVVIALGKQFTYISSVHPSAKWVPGYRLLKCIDGH